MTTARNRRGLCLGLIVAAVTLLGVSPALAVTAKPAWAPVAVSGPTHLPPGGSGQIAIYVQNVGGATSTGTITVEDQLPAGLLTAGTPTGPEGHEVAWSCTPGAGNSSISCNSTEAVGPGQTPQPIEVPLAIDPAASGAKVNLVSVSGAGADNLASYEQTLTISANPAKPGFETFTANAYDVDGAKTTQAGSHPYSAASAIFVNTVRNSEGKIVPAGNPKTIGVELPPGFLGNPIAAPTCSEGIEDYECPIESQVGVAQPVLDKFGIRGNPVPVHNILAPYGYPGKFTFEAQNVFRINALGSLRSEDDYGISVTSFNTPQVAQAVYGVIFTFWGAPEDPSHEGQRCEVISPPSGCGPGAPENTAFLTMPTDCAFQAEAPPFSRLILDTWQTPGQFDRPEFAAPSVKGCENLKFAADFKFEPSNTTADSPASFRTNLTVPEEGLTNPSKLTTPEIRKTVVQLPKGVVLNASGADGLQACSESQIGYLGGNFPMPNPMRFNLDPNHCPEASKIGSGELKSALLEEPLHGALYLAAQGDGNPFGSLFAIYLVIEDPRHGIFIKLPGRVDPNETDGQMTVTFENLPQLPFTRLDLNLKGGNRSALASPTTCGNYTTTATNTPWSAPESGPPTVSANGFDINQGPGGMPCAKTPQERPFDIGWKAGTDNKAAGASSPFDFEITRPDGSQEIDTLSLTTPPGLSASLKGVPYCSEAEIKTAEGSTGKQEQANPACPGASQVGRLEVGTGSGPTPFYTGGKLYLAGPYKGAPISVVSVTPAVAGPFDLGNVVSRNALFIDRQTAQVSAKSDSIPQILKGVVLRIRDIRIFLNHKDWTLNPTSCDSSSVNLTIHGNSGATAQRSTRFQAGNCQNLGFRPKLTANLKGATKRGDHPAFTATLKYPEGPGYANIKDVQVTLPHSEFLDQAHINTICTRVQAAAHQCPQGSIYGYAEAITPLLDAPLTGPVFLKSSDHQLPDLAIALKGPANQPIEVEFQGRIDSVHAQIRNTIEGLPDVPVSKFVLRMKGGKKGLLVNSRNLCASKATKMTVKMSAQNNKQSRSRPTLTRSCKKAKKHKQAKRHGKQGRAQLNRLMASW